MNQQISAVANTPSGKLRGLYEDGLYVFKGVPYATAPVGNRRWLPPEPVEQWQGIRSAGNFGPTAPQRNSPSAIFKRLTPEEPRSEDCLFLNVWSPGLDDMRRPVMVWIHGGAFSMGSGSSPMHPGDTLAKRGNIVMVSLNYRLGPLGFLRLKEVTNGAIPSTGNEGLLDQIAALKWVKDNVAVFGGDPANITVFGESAGAMSIGCLLAMPKAGGLFQKAILQSGASTYRTRDEADKIAARFLGKLGIETGNTAKLRSLSAESLINVSLPQQEPGAQEAQPNFHGMAFEPVVDGETLPDIPLDAIRKGSARGVTVLTGSNLEEAKLFGMTSPAHKRLDEERLLKRVRWLLPPEYEPTLIQQYRTIRHKRGLDASPHEILMAIQTDIQFRIPDVRLAEIQHSLGVKAYNYLFDWESSVPGLGSCHALDVGFIFNKCEEGFHGAGPAAEKLAGQMQDAWIAFSRNGDPSCESLGHWPLYGKSRNTMLLGKDSHVEAAPYEEERRIWDNVPSALLG